MADVEAVVPSAGLRERGPLLITHWGLSGPVILRLSAWGARVLCEAGYRFPLHVNWLPAHTADSLAQEFQARRMAELRFASSLTNLLPQAQSHVPGRGIELSPFVPPASSSGLTPLFRFPACEAG